MTDAPAPIPHTADTPATESPPAPRRRRRWLRGLLILLFLLIAIPLGLVAWLLGSESGLRQAAALANRFGGGMIAIDGVSGRVLDGMRLGEVRVRTADLRLDLQGAELRWTPRALFDKRAEVARLAVDSVALATRPSNEPAPPPAEPAPLRLPLALDVATVAVGELKVCAWADSQSGPCGEDEPTFAIKNFTTGVASDGALHQVRDLAVDTPFGHLTLAGTIDTGTAGYPLDLKAGFNGAYAERPFSVTADLGGDLRDLKVDVHGTSEDIEAQVEVAAAPFAEMPLGKLRLTLEGVNPQAFAPAAPMADLRIEAEFAPIAGEGWVLEGPLKVVNAAPGTVDSGKLPLESLATQARVSAKAARLDQLLVELPGEGKISGMLDWTADDSGATPGQLTAALELAGIRPQQIQSTLPNTVVQGRLDAEGGIAEQTADLDVRIGEAAVVATGLFVPASGETPARFEAKGELRQLDPAAFVPDAPKAALNLTFDTEGVLKETAEIGARWQFAPSRIANLPLTGKGDVKVIGARLTAADVALALAGNDVKLKGAWGARGDVMNVNIDAPRLNQLGSALKLPLAGTARIQGTVGGSAAEPVANLDLRADGLRVPGDVGIGALRGKVAMAAGLDGPLDIKLDVRDVGPRGGASKQPDWLKTASLVVQGPRARHTLALDLATPQADTVKLALAGGLVEAKGNAPLRWDGMLQTLQVGGRLPLKLTAPASLTLGADAVRLGNARIDAGEHGQLVLADTRWSPQEIIAKGSLDGVAVDLVRLDSADSERPRRQRDPLTLAGNWDLTLGRAANGTLHIYRKSGNLRIPGEARTRLAFDALDVRANLRNNAVQATLDVRGPEVGTWTGSVNTRLQKTGTAWALPPSAPLDGRFNLDMASLEWLSRLSEGQLSLGGKLTGDVALSGTVGKPVASGRINGEELAVTLIEQGVSLSGGSLDASFDRDVMRVNRLEFVSANKVQPGSPRVPVERFTQTPGRLTASGEFALATGVGALNFEADRLPILQRADRWLLLSGKGEANANKNDIRLDADFGVDSGYFEMPDAAPPALGDDVVIIEPDAKEVEQVGGTSVTANVNVKLGDELHLSALGLNTRLGGELQLRMRPGQPLTGHGTLATRGGTFRNYGQDLTIERGLINFQGPIDNPGLNVLALRKGLAVEAGIEVSGSAKHPVIKLVSSPDVPDPEKLSWLVLGRAPSGEAGKDMGALLPAAQALLGGGGGGLTDGLQRGLGMDEFGIGSGELNSTQRAATSRVVGGGQQVTGEGVGGQVLSMGKRLSSDLFVSFEQALGGAETLVKLTWQLSQRVSVVVRGGTDTSADVKYTVSFR